MATNKLGTLVYDLVADTKDFQQGLVKAGKPLTALKKLFIESRTPIEHFGIQLQGMQQMIREGAGPLNMFSRSIADLAMQTKGGGRVAREFVQTLRKQASEIVATTGQYHALSQVEKDRVNRIRAAANEIEREINIRTRSRQESERNARVIERETQALARKAAEERRIATIQEKRRASAKSAATQQAESFEAGRSARVRSIVEQTITPTQKLARAMSEVREEFRLGNINQQQFFAAQKHVRNEYVKAKDALVPYAELVKKTNSRMQNFAAGMAAQVGALARQISAITAAYAVINQARRGISGALELGRSTKEFEIFTGSAQTSLALMSDIRNLAAETPLTMGASTQTVRTLLQYGTSAQDVMDITRRLGDISGGSTERMQRLALAMGQITANGRLQGQELRQLVESGFNPLQVLSERLNVSMLELRVRMAEGAISTEDVASALRSATSEGGRFANALERIGDETAFGQIQKLRGEYEKLRDEIYGPIIEVASGLAALTTKAIRGGRQFVRFFAEGATKESFEMAKKMTLVEALLGAFAGDANLANVFGRLVFANLIEVERRAMEMEQAQIDAAEQTEEAYSKVNDSIVDRIAKLRQEREEIILGKDEYFIANAERLGASSKYITQLRDEINLTNQAREADEKRIKAEREAEERAARRQRAEKKAIEDRRRQIEQDRKAAEALLESVYSPLEKLEQQMQEIQRLAKFLTPLQRVKLMDQALEAFNKQDATETTQAAAAVTRGSVEEFKLIAEINSTQVDQQQKHHNEAQDQRKQMNKKLDLQITGIDMLPLKLGEELSELMPTAVGSSPASGGGFFGPRRGPEAYN